MQTTAPSEEILELRQLSRQMMQMTTGYWVSQAIYVAAKFGVADALVSGPQSSEWLARQLQVNSGYLYRVLRALASVGIFEELPEQKFQLNPMGQLLRSDISASMRDVAVMMGEEHYHAWGHLEASLTAGDIPFERVYGMPVFEYFKAHPESSETFNGAMTALSSSLHAAVLQSFDFTSYATIVDVGGGHGRLLSAILQHYPQAQGQLLDMAHVVSGAMTQFEAEGVADRVTVHSGDFFQDVVSGGDVYLLAHILHDWRDDLALAILRNIHRAMNPAGKLLIIEHVVGEPNQSPMAKLMDLNMLVMTTGGCERTEPEYRDLLAQAGFRLERLAETPSGISVIEAVPT